MTHLTIKELHQLRTKLEISADERQQLNEATLQATQELLTLLKVQFQNFAYDEQIEALLCELLALLRENEMMFDARVEVDLINK